MGSVGDGAVNARLRVLILVAAGPRLHGWWGHQADSPLTKTPCVQVLPFIWLEVSVEGCLDATSAPTLDSPATPARPAALTLARAFPFWLKLGFITFGGQFEAIPAVIVAAATIALFRLEVGVMPLLGACAAAGLVVTLVFPVLR